MVANPNSTFLKDNAKMAQSPLDKFSMTVAFALDRNGLLKGGAQSKGPKFAPGQLKVLKKLFLSMNEEDQIAAKGVMTEKVGQLDAL